MKRFLNYKILFILILISYFNIARSEAMKLREANLQRFKEKFDIQLSLYNGETLPKLIPSVEGKITDNKHLLKDTKYIYISALYKGIGFAYLTIDVKSLNNPGLKLIDHTLVLDGNVRQHEVKCLSTPVMDTADDQAVFSYEIKGVSFK